MSIKFINYEERNENVKELKEILFNLHTNPIKNDIKADFLRKFTLAAIDTFRKKSYSPEIKNININVPERLDVQAQTPKKVDLPLELFLKAPRKIDISEELLEEAPDKELNVNAPGK
ncbi:MAG: hypothetical protein AABW56_01965 [Nanoarchaeota archaeon]